jgi:hypothetical protein
MDSKTIIALLGSVLALIYFGGLIRVMWYERKINQLYAEFSKKTEYERNQPVAMPVINGRIEQHKIFFEPKISELERKRRFILDKLPFIRK